MTVIPMRADLAAPGARFTNGQAQEIGPFLEQQEGWPSLTPEVVVEAAKPADSPMHRLFEWRDRVAADLYRKEQARHILNHLRIIHAGEPTKAYHSVSPPEGSARRQYLHLDRVRAEPEDAGEVIAQAQAELEGWLNRHNQYQRILGPLFGAVEQAVLSYRQHAVAS